MKLIDEPHTENQRGFPNATDSSALTGEPALHPRITRLKERIRSQEAAGCEYVARLYDALQKYEGKILGLPYRPSELGWDDLESLQQFMLRDWVSESLRKAQHKMSPAHAVPGAPEISARC